MIKRLRKFKVATRSFVDAQKQHKKHPETFYAPSKGVLSEIKKGSIVKVSVGGERFWVIVSKVGGNHIDGQVDNDLICTDSHSLVCGDMISFHKKNIFQIYKTE